ncbi:MAG TPA: glycosyltransferase family 4 protein [Acidimicrobiales bacterium]|nr:glycosyltransferase family 4 protein [Acidimicrobiales bacterium]
MTASAPDLLILSPHLAPPPGGVQRLALDIADALGDWRVRVVGVSEAPSSDPRVRVVRQRSGRLGAVLTNLDYARVVASELRDRPRIVQAMTWRAALPALVPGRPPMVLYCHGAELLRRSSRLGQRLRTFVLAHADALVSNSSFTQAVVRDACGRAAVVVNPPVAAIHADVARRTPDEDIHVLSVGRLVPNKGHDRLLRAVAEVRASGVSMRVTIVGGGPEYQALQSLAGELGLGEVTRIAGAVPDDELAALYGSADVFALLSVPIAGEVEGFGIVFLEANSYGLPVIAGRSGGSQEAVAEGLSGFVVDGHAEAVAALKKLANDPELRTTLGEGGRARLAEFTPERFRDRLRAVYAGLR